MAYELPEGATPLFTIKIENGKAVSTPIPGWKEAIQEQASLLEEYVEEHGEPPEAVKPWEELANAVVRHQLEKADED